MFRPFQLPVFKARKRRRRDLEKGKKLKIWISIITIKILPPYLHTWNGRLRPLVRRYFVLTTNCVQYSLLVDIYANHVNTLYSVT